DRAGAGLLPGRGRRRGRARLRSLHAALLAAAALAGRQFRWRRVRHHLEPSVVPGLPVAVHAGADRPVAAAGVRRRPAPAGLAGWPARRVAAVAAGPAAGAVRTGAADALRYD